MSWAAPEDGFCLEQFGTDWWDAEQILFRCSGNTVQPPLQSGFCCPGLLCLHLLVLLSYRPQEYHSTLTWGLLSPPVSRLFAFGRCRRVKFGTAGWREHLWLLTSEMILTAQWLTHAEISGSSAEVWELRKKALQLRACNIWGDDEETSSRPLICGLKWVFRKVSVCCGRRGRALLPYRKAVCLWVLLLCGCFLGHSQLRGVVNFYGLQPELGGNDRANMLTTVRIQPPPPTTQTSA